MSRVPSFDLSGKVAFVPGGYGAIGAAIARGLAHHGAEVVTFDDDFQRIASVSNLQVKLLKRPTP